MSAPMRASQNDDTGCFTDTAAAAPFDLLCSDQAIPASGVGGRGACFGVSGFSKTMPLVLSWLQSGSGRSSLATASASSGSVAVMPGFGACWARAADRPAPASANSTLKPFIVVLEIMILPARSPDNAFTAIQNYDLADFVATRIDKHLS